MQDKAFSNSITKIITYSPLCEAMNKSRPKGETGSEAMNRFFRDIAEAMNPFFQEEDRFKIGPMADLVASECLKFVPGGVLAHNLVSGLLGEVNKSEDQALYAKLDMLEREFQEYKTLYEEKAEEIIVKLNRLENVLKEYVKLHHEQKEKQGSFVCYWITMLLAIPLGVLLYQIYPLYYSN